MSYDEDPPTRRLPLPPREPVPRERVPGGEPGAPVPGPVLSEVEVYDFEQRLRSMRGWLTALAVVAVLALVVAAIALVSSGDDDSSGTRTPAALRNDVERLEERVEDRATKGQLNALKDDIAELRTDVSQAASAAESAGDTTTTTESADVSGLQEDLSDLSSRVEALEQAPDSEGTATEGTTP